ncbi:BACON domain-containing protein [Thalassotalea sp. G2M2-11]|uniref:BACON domain-containing protein n=1 Tax=Thalassotalea sp. G2M2-11 TaxID=2787627 RepID=UPI0019D009F5|nr:BACON domain-containing protein [Thalassotalea sp. G2M2-11]
MKDYLNHFYRLIYILTLAVALQACGGSNDKSENYTISANTTAITFSNEFLQVSDDTYQVDVTFNGKGLLVGFAPDSQLASWLNYQTKNVTENSASLIINVVNAENIIASQYNTTLRLSTGDVDKVNLVHHDIDISLLVWQLSTNKEQINFQTTYGETTLASQTLDIVSENNQWIAQSDVDWLSLDISEGNGNGQITISPKLELFRQAGLYQGNIVLTEMTSGDTKNVPVNIALDPIRLYGHTPAIAFNQQFNLSYLTQTVDILTNAVTDIDWLATSSAEWLTLTPDSENNRLTVSVDPTKVADNGFYSADILLSPQEPAASSSATIKVSFTKGNFDTNDLPEVIISEVTANNNATVLDPLRPYLYIAQGDTIKAFNIIDGLEVSSTVSPLPGFELTNLVIHPDGSMMLVSNNETYVDENEQEQTRTNYYQFDLTDLSFTQLDSSLIDIEYPPKRIIMVSGQPVVVTQALELANLSLQRQYWDVENAFLTSTIDYVAASNHLLAFDAANLNLKHHSLSYNAFAPSSVKIESTQDYVNTAFNSGIAAIATSKSGQYIYTVNSLSEWSTFDGETFNDQGMLDGNALTIPVAITTDNNDNSYVYRFDSEIGYFTLSQYDSHQVNTWTAAYSAGSTEVYLSAAYQRVIHYNRDENKLVIDYISH